MPPNIEVLIWKIDVCGILQQTMSDYRRVTRFAPIPKCALTVLLLFVVAHGGPKLPPTKWECIYGPVKMRVVEDQWDKIWGDVCVSSFEAGHTLKLRHYVFYVGPFVYKHRRANAALFPTQFTALS